MDDKTTSWTGSTISKFMELMTLQSQFGNKNQRQVKELKMKTLKLKWQMVVMMMVVVMAAGSAEAATNYVWSGGTGVSPFATWATAATNVQDAVDYANSNYPAYDTVLVTNGTYLQDTELIVSNGITIHGLNGWVNTIIKRNPAAGNFRLFSLTHADAVLSGLTITDGYQKYDQDWGEVYSGAGINMSAGMVTNCYVTNCEGGRQSQWAKVQGGGIYMTGGTVVDSTIHDNRYSDMIGGGVYMTGGLVDRCTLSNNQAGQQYGSPGRKKAGSGAYMTGGTLRNSLIKDNDSVYWAGGGVYLDGAGARMENCTVVGNTVAGSTGGGVQLGSGAALNCVVWSNTVSGGPNDIAGALSSAIYSCAPELTSGDGNITADPLFADPAEADYSLNVSSPCVDTGTNLVAVVRDLAGNLRPQDGRGYGGAELDMGCYELAAPGDVFGCNLFTTNDTTGYSSLDDVEFRAIIFGDSISTNIDYYWWDFGNGTLEGGNLGTVTRTFGPGRYDIELTVSNSLGETATRLMPGLIEVVADVAFVSTNGTSTFPYNTWACATDSLVSANNVVVQAMQLGATSGSIMIGDGTFTIGAELTLNRSLVIASVNGPSNSVIVQGGSETRAVYMTHADAMVSGVTLRDAYSVAGMDGMGVYMTAGTVSNCIITNCRGGYQDNKTLGGGINMSGGLVVDTTVRQCRSTAMVGGGIYISGGLVDRCVISENQAGILHGSPRAGGAGIYMTGGTVRNSLIADNDTALRGGGGVQMTSASAVLENCTVVGNTIPAPSAGNDEWGAGVRVMTSVEPSAPDVDPQDNRGRVRNCIVWGNLRGGVQDDIRAHTNAVSYTCANSVTNVSGAVWGLGNTTNAPAFENAGAGDYRLLKTSPCIDKGLDDLSWMTGALDLAGAPRIQNKAVDMGAYETFVPPAGTVIIIK